MSTPGCTDEPRPHHYQFAHRWLRDIALRYGSDFVRDNPRGNLTGALVAMWHEVGTRLPEVQRLAPDGLATDLRPDPSTPMVVVTMPAARHMVEAHFAAIVLCDEQTRYFVLEESWSPTEPVATVLGEWIGDSHINLGPGPAPDRTAFIEAVLTRVQPHS